MKKIILLSILIALHAACFGQSVENKVNIYIGYGSGSFLGEKMVKDQNFISPSLFSNYKNLTSGSYKLLINISKVLRLGLVYEHSQLSGWESNISTSYLYSRCIQNSISPEVQLHTRYHESGLFNRVKICLDVAPVLGQSKLSLDHSLFDIKDGNIFVNGPMSSERFFYGLKGAAGMEIVASDLVGIYCSYSLEYALINSKLFEDRHFIAARISAGMFLRLIKDKRFY